MADQLQILQAIETLLRTGLADVEFARNDYTLADPGEIARVNMFDGDPGAPLEELLGSRCKTYRHEILLEIVPRRLASEIEAHAIHKRIKTLVAGDRWLGGLVDDLELSELATVPTPVSDAQALITASASLIAEYTL